MRLSLAVALVSHCCTTVTTELAAENNSHMCSLQLCAAAVRAVLTCLPAQGLADYTRYWRGVLFLQRLCLVIYFYTTSGFGQNSTPPACWSKNCLYWFVLCWVGLHFQSDYSQTHGPSGSTPKVLILQVCAFSHISCNWHHAVLDFCAFKDNKRSLQS